MIRRPPRSTLDRSSAASDVYKRQDHAKCGSDEKHDDMLCGRHVDRDRTQMKWCPVWKLELASEARFEARILQVVRVRDVRSDDVLASEHMRSRRMRTAVRRAPGQVLELRFPSSSQTVLRCAFPSAEPARMQ